MAIAIKIEKRIPLPKKYQPQWKDGIDWKQIVTDMKNGDSFVVSDNKVALRVKNRCWRLHCNGSDSLLVSRPLPDGTIRIWKMKRTKLGIKEYNQ